MSASTSGSARRIGDARSNNGLTLSNDTKVLLREVPEAMKIPNAALKAMNWPVLRLLPLSISERAVTNKAKVPTSGTASFKTDMAFWNVLALYASSFC